MILANKKTLIAIDQCLVAPPVGLVPKRKPG